MEFHIFFRDDVDMAIGRASMIPIFVQRVAPIERQRNPGRRSSSQVAPGFHFVQSGLQTATAGEGVDGLDEETAARVRKVLSGRRDVVEKKMMGGLSFMGDGAMFCSVSGRGGLLVRVGAEAQEGVLREPHVQPVGMGKRMMTGFVRVAPEGYRTDAALKKWVERGIASAAANPPAARAKQKRTAPKRAAAQGK
jgi:TfoX/Sxy family transcriptional regulator of competence genes